MYYFIPPLLDNIKVERIKDKNEDNLEKDMSLKGGELIWIGEYASPMYKNMYAKFDRYINDEICFVMIGKRKKIAINIEFINRVKLKF